MFSPPVTLYPAAPFVSTISIHGYYGEIAANATTPASGAFAGVNNAYYHPIVVPLACVAYRLFWLNGTTAGTNNVQVGIYNDNDAGTDGPGTAVVRGTSTLASGASACQFDDITDTPLSPGRYWLAIWANGTTTTIFRSLPSGNHAKMTGPYVETGLSGGLPATATPATLAAPYVPIYGFTTIPTP